MFAVDFNKMTRDSLIAAWLCSNVELLMGAIDYGHHNEDGDDYETATGFY